MRLVKSILGRTLKTKFFKHRVYNENCKNFYLQLVLKNQMAEFFEKKNKTKQENPNFGPLCRNGNLPLKLNCISFYRLKILSHIQKKRNVFETSNVEILRKVVNSGHPPCKKEKILNIYEIIKLLQYNHHHMNSIHFSN